jgi:TRAP-type uncharacterized transport system fused permease subunit
MPQPTPTAAVVATGPPARHLAGEKAELSFTMASTVVSLLLSAPAQQRSAGSVCLLLNIQLAVLAVVAQLLTGTQRCTFLQGSTKHIIQTCCFNVQGLLGGPPNISVRAL